MALFSSDEPEKINFSGMWIIPLLVLEMSAGILSVNNLSFLVADACLYCENVLVVHTVLGNLGMYYRTLLEGNRSVLKGTDC